MKESPQIRNLEALLRSSKLVAGGFMGQDPRSVSEIIEEDGATLFRSGVTIDAIARRMQDITTAAISAMGTVVRLNDILEAHIDEYKGLLVCPWPHSGRYPKRITTVRNSKTGQIIRWSDLNIHLIAEHGFFEGRGSPFRVEPADLMKNIL